MTKLSTDSKLTAIRLLHQTDINSHHLVNFMAHDVGDDVDSFIAFWANYQPVFDDGVTFEKMLSSANTYLGEQSHNHLKFEVINGKLCYIKDLPNEKGISELNSDTIYDLANLIYLIKCKYGD